MFNLPMAPKDISPGKFFTEWLPRQLEPWAGLIGSMAGDVSAAIATRVLGPGGGEWTAELAGGKVKVSSGLKPDAVVTFIVPEKNFLEIVTGQRQNMMQPPPGAAGKSPQEMASQAKDTLTALRDIQGSVKFVIEDDKAPFEATVKFAGPLTDEPSCTLTVGLDTVQALAKGETNPQAAFMAGQIKIEGDMTILMQLMPLMQQ
jgi:putative sterol carrier protein